MSLQETKSEEEIIGRMELTNTCTCQQYDEDKDEWYQPEYCYGTCWEDDIYFASIILQDLMDNNETNWWKVSNLRFWDGERSGYFYAKTIEDLIRGMTVRSEWNMSLTVYKDRAWYSLSHHDAPMGSNSFLYPVSDEEREDKGLY
jgi:hypothetical protein